MSEKQHPKKHHYVPQCYLKNFTFDSKLYVLDVRKVQKGYKELPSLLHTASICYFPNYYTIEENMGDSEFRLNAYDALYIERDVLSKLENKYGKIFEKISRNNALMLQDAIDLTDFIIQLKLRNPYWMKETLEKNKNFLIDSALDSLDFDKFTDNARLQYIPKELINAVIESVKDKNKLNPTFSKQMQLFSLIQRNDDIENYNEKFRLALIDCKWMVFESPQDGPYFITSDNPGYSLKGNDGKTYNTNYSDPFVFFFPLSPKLCLVISGEEKDNSYIDKSRQKILRRGGVTADVVITINNSSMQCVTNLIIAVDTTYLSEIAVLNKPK